MNTRKTRLFFVIFVLLFVINGCGKETANNADEMSGSYRTDASRGNESQAPSWNISHTALNGQYDFATINGNLLYGCSYTTEGAVIQVHDLTTGQDNETYQIPGVTEIHNLTVDTKQQLCLFGSTKTGNTLWQIAPDEKIHTIDDIVLEDVGIQLNLKNFTADKSGHYYLWYEMSVPMSEVLEDDGQTDFDGAGQPVYIHIDRIYVKDRNMNTICYEMMPTGSFTHIIALLFDENDIPMLLCRDGDDHYLRRVRTVSGEEYKPEFLDAPEFPELNRGDRIVMTQNGLLYIKDGALHHFHMLEGTDEKLLDLSEGGIYEEDVIYLGMRGETVEIIDNYQGSDRSEYTCVEAGTGSQVTVTVGVMSLEQNLQKLITSFNRYQNEVRIKPVIYASNNDYAAGYEKLKMDVIRDKAPDIIDTPGIDYEILAKAGAFRDLYEFMDQDSECSRSAFVPAILRSYEIDGHFYTASSSFVLDTMWGGESLVQGRYGVDTATLIRILQKHGGGINSLWGVFNAGEDRLRKLCSAGMDEFIDWEKGTCDFTGDAFRQTLELLKNYRPDFGRSHYLSIREKKCLLKIGTITSVEDYLLEKELFGEDVEFIGFPTGKGSGTAVHMLDILALNSHARHPDEAWKFLRYYMLQGSEIYITGFPVAKERFEKLLADSMDYLTTEADGQTEKIARKYYYEKDIVSFSIYKASQEDVNAIRELVERADRKYEYNNAIQNIIDEEAASYFLDQKTLEAVTEIIQNRVQLYLNEQK